MEDLIEKIMQWGHDRGIIKNSTPLAQSRKTIEEVHELITACAVLERQNECRHTFSPLWNNKATEELADALGDVFVTLVMVAGCAGLDIQACIAQAYDEIKDRKGYLRPDGVFVKEST
jgi:NTP pyrophosphatase (non-canonical NTP hydrolase)